MYRFSVFENFFASSFIFLHSFLKSCLLFAFVLFFISFFLYMHKNLHTPTHTHTHTHTYIYIYIYIYMCVCVCVCVVSAEEIVFKNYLKIYLQNLYNAYTIMYLFTEPNIVWPKARSMRVDYLWWHVNLSKIILCLAVREIRFLYIYIYIFCFVVFEGFYTHLYITHSYLRQVIITQFNVFKYSYLILITIMFQVIISI